MILAMSNGVNLTDGLDGLATGASVMVFGAYVVIGIWQFEQRPAPASAPTAACYEVRDPLDLAVVAAAVDGRLLRLPVVERVPGARSSWATPARSRSAARSPAWRSCTRTELLLVAPRRPVRRSSRCRWSSRSAPSSSPASGSSGWRRCSTTSSSRAGPRYGRGPVLDHRRALRGLGLGVFYAEWVVGRVTRARPSERLSRPRRRLGRSARRRRRPRRLRLRRRRRPARARRARRRGRRRRRAGERERAELARRAAAPTSGSASGGRFPRAAPTSSSPRPAGGPTPRCSRRRRGRRPGAGARSSSPGGCGRPTGAAPWLAVTGTNGKTTTVDDARVDPARRRAAARPRPATSARRCSRRCSHPRALRRARGRALQLPAALDVVGRARPPAPASTSPPTTSTGTASSRRTPRPRAGSTSTPRSPASTTSPTR